MAKTARDMPIRLVHTDVSARPWRNVGNWPGVRDKVLWEDPDTHSYAGLMQLDPGAMIPPHVHTRHAHHVWIVVGFCSSNGADLGPGSYEFIPPGSEHTLVAEGPDGCSFFYLYQHVT